MSTLTWNRLIPEISDSAERLLDLIDKKLGHLYNPTEDLLDYILSSQRIFSTIVNIPKEGEVGTITVDSLDISPEDILIENIDREKMPYYKGVYALLVLKSGGYDDIDIMNHLEVTMSRWWFGKLKNEILDWYYDYRRR